MTRILLALIAFYRRWVSPALHALGGGGGCRFVPTCSDYASIAIASHGPIRGSGLAIWRLLRCHPFCRGGLDTVPITTQTKNRISAKPMAAGRKQNRQTGAAAAHLPHEPLP
jgi:uncharacterized protein